MIDFIERIDGYECEITDPMRKISIIYAAVKDLSIVDVLSHYGVEFKRGGGGRYLSLCPFHMDNHIGSFSVDAKKNSCWCYACATGGDIVNSVMQMLNITDWQQAVLQIAMDEDLIDSDIFDELSKVEYVCKKKNSTGPRLIQYVGVSKDTATLKMWTDIYEYLQSEWKLIPEHERQLREERQLKEERIKKDYFTMRSTDPKATAAMVLKIKNKFPEYTDKLITVPGFYEYLTSDWFITMLQFSGSGILIRDANDNVIGVQVRMDKVDSNGLRYKFFSYEFTQSKYNRGGGTCGTPIDVVYPETITERTNICVTEGRFKSEVLAQQGMISLSVQGVNNFAGIDATIADVERKIGRKLTTLHVFYDADMVRNVQVYKAAIALASYLEEARPDIEVRFAVWSKIYGKGIDDMIFQGYRSEVKSIDLNRFKKTYHKSFAAAEKATGIDASKVSKLSKEERTKFLDSFEIYAEKMLLNGVYDE